MIDEIQKYKPKGATHWQCGSYYFKTKKWNWFKHLYFNKWTVVKKEDVSELCMTTL